MLQKIQTTEFWCKGRCAGEHSTQQHTGHVSKSGMLREDKKDDQEFGISVRSDSNRRDLIAYRQNMQTSFLRKCLHGSSVVGRQAGGRKVEGW